MSNRKKKTEMDEVEELLRATEDDILLKLSVNSHMSRGSSSSIIDPDLDRRFQALRKPTKIPSKPNPPPAQSSSSTLPKPKTQNPEIHEDVFARFAALKGSKSDNSNPPPSSSFSFDKDDDEDEVEKLIRWAVDAARLDPSPPSDDSDDSNDDDEVEAKKKGKRR